jgi:exo-1,4-beta-D-glucosaminidase
MRLLRAHPSSLVWAYGSDELPPDTVLSAWKAIASNLHWQNPTLDNVASYANPNGSVPKMNGPYAWEPPVYWYVDTIRGNAFGFCAEQGGESVPAEETLHRCLSPANVWPIGPAYGYHSGPSPFNNLNWYSLALNSRYGAAGDLTQYSDRAQSSTTRIAGGLMKAPRRGHHSPPCVLDPAHHFCWVRHMFGSSPPRGVAGI